MGLRCGLSKLLFALCCVDGVVTNGLDFPSSLEKEFFVCIPIAEDIHFIAPSQSRH